MSESDIVERVDHLEEEVAQLQSDAQVAGDEVIFRPPLWSQNSAYSAADDRRLITAALWPGVVDLGDLRVTQRAEGANLSVDVAPGHVVIPGTDQVDQGSYLCALSQRVNIPIASGPAAGNVRADMILARVYEPVDAPAYWRVERQLGRPLPNWNWTDAFDPSPPSSFALAIINVGDATTTQITNDRLIDMRHLTRPSPIGSMGVWQQRLGPMVTRSANQQRWGAIERLVAGGVPGHSLGVPLDIEVRIEGVMRTEGGAPAIGSIGLNIARGPQGGPFTDRSDAVNIFSPELAAMMHFSRSFVISGYQPEWNHSILAEAAIAETPLAGGGARFHSGLLTLRISPGGSTMLW